MSKKLTVSHIKNKAKIYELKDKLIFHEVDENGNEEDFHVEYFPNFSNDKIQELFLDLGKVYNEAEKLDIKIPEQLKTDFLSFFILKHFTLMSLPKDTKTFIQFFLEFVKTDYYKEIMNAFPIESITKVMDRLYEVQNVVADMKKLQREQKKQYESMELNNRAEIDAIITSNAGQTPAKE